MKKEHPNADLSTEELMKMIQSNPKQFKNDYLLADQKDLTLRKYLNRLMDKKDINAAFLIREAFISKTYLYQILNGERLPGRDMVLRIAFVMSASLDETQRLLTLSGKSILYPKIRRDAAIIWCLQMHQTMAEASQFLKDLGEDALL